MKLPVIIFGLLLAMCVAAGIILTLDEAPGGHGVEHSTYATMDHGGPWLARHEGQLWVGWAFGILQIGLFVGCLMLGVRDRNRLGRRVWPFVIGGLLYAAVFTVLILAYGQYARQDAPSFFLSFPLPTAVMLFGIWPVPLIFLIIYVANFDRWILTPNDLDRFQEIVRKNRQRRGDES